jgi:hypothetical protein
MLLDMDTTELVKNTEFCATGNDIEGSERRSTITVRTRNPRQNIFVANSYDNVLKEHQKWDGKPIARFF